MEIPPYLPTPLFAHCAPLGRCFWINVVGEKVWPSIHPSIGSIHKAITVLARKKVEHLGNPLVPLGKMQHFANQDASRLCCNIQCYLAACLQGLAKCKNFTTLWAILQSKSVGSSRPTATYLLTYKRLPNLDCKNFEIPARAKCYVLKKLNFS